MTSQLANAIRFLSADAVQQANSGHPGAPMGMADMAEVLWNQFLRHNPANPHFVNRDRFVLSNGHASMLIYSLLHLTGYKVSIEDLKNFRQWHSNTPGHPEYGYTDGVETTTGPLGQGIANAVGMALAEYLLAKEFNRDGFPIVDHYTYVFLGDGCLMEGISHEVASLAGTLGLGKLICLYDDNNISIDGKIDNWFSENVPERFESYGWHVVGGVDGHDPVAIEQRRALELVREQPVFAYDHKRQENPSGFVVDTMQAVLQAFFATESFEDCLVDVVNRGGDADTTGAIAGMLAGARYGMAGIPKRWLRALDEFTRLACEKQAEALINLALGKSSTTQAACA